MFCQLSVGVRAHLGISLRVWLFFGWIWWSFATAILSEEQQMCFPFHISPVTATGTSYFTEVAIYHLNQLAAQADTLL